MALTDDIKKIKYSLYIGVCILLLTMFLALIFYPGEYLFFDYFISELGSKNPIGGGDNYISQLIFSVGFITSGIFALIVAVLHLKKEYINTLNLFKAFCLIVSFIGSIFVVFPYDITELKTVHGTGAGLFLFGLLMYITLSQVFRQREGEGISVDTKESHAVTFDKVYIIIIQILAVILTGLTMAGFTNSTAVILQKCVVFFALFGIFTIDNDDFLQEKITSTNEISINVRKIKFLLNFVTFLFTITVLLAWAFYPDTYDIIIDFISYLGGIRTKDNLINNLISQIMFTIGIILCAIFAFIASLEYFKKDIRNWFNSTKGILLIIVSIGAVFLTIPHDQVPWGPRLHSRGAVTFILGISIYCAICQIFRYKNTQLSVDTGERWHITPDKIFIVFTLIILLVYAILAMNGKKDAQEILQKVVIINSFICIWTLDDEDF